jgi:hypothetical protein
MAKQAPWKSFEHKPNEVESRQKHALADAIKPRCAMAVGAQAVQNSMLCQTLAAYACMPCTAAVALLLLEPHSGSSLFFQASSATENAASSNYDGDSVDTGTSCNIT